MKKDFKLEFQKTVEEIRNNRNQVILNYLDLVDYIVENRFKDIECDKEELYQVCVLGIIEAVDSFENSGKKIFDYYVITMIKGKINEFVEKNANMQILHYDTVDEICIDEEVNIETDYEKQVDRKKLREYVYKLPYLSREVMKMYYGFYGKCYSFKEIALIFNVKEQQIKSLVAKELRTIRKLVSTSEKSNNKSKVLKRKY